MVLDRVGSGFAREWEWGGPRGWVGEATKSGGDVDEKAPPCGLVEGRRGGLRGLAVDKGEVDKVLPGRLTGQEGAHEGPQGCSDPRRAREALNRPCRPPHSAKRGRVFGMLDITGRGYDRPERSIHDYLGGTDMALGEGQGGEGGVAPDLSRPARMPGPRRR